MMASSSSSSKLSDHLLQGDLPWPSSSSLPFARALHSTIGGNHQSSQPPMLNCADHHHLSAPDELEVLLSAQGHHHNHQAASPLIPPQLSSLLMMQDLGFQWSNCSFADTSMLMASRQQNGHNKIKEEQRRESLDLRSPCSAGTTIASHDIINGGTGGLPAMAAADLDGIVPPSINISRPQQKPCPAAPPPLPGDTFEILASSRLCKTLLLSQAASSVLLHNGMPLLRSEHVPYGPPAAHAQGPSIDNYKMGVPWVNNEAGGHQWSAERNAACQKATPVSSPAPAPKKPRFDSRSSTIVPSFKVRKEKLGDRIAALQQLVSPFGKTDTASVLMEAIGYIKFLQDQVEALSGSYLRSSRNKKPRTTQRGSSNATGGEQEETRLDLRSRGLCLVPLSCTSYVTNENGVWAPPNFRGN
uniref:BHLH domain-containing protein n=1 Tax=Arundo donax TaxID=35708 RepID=A0A0A9EPI8_ARUDO